MDEDAKRLYDKIYSLLDNLKEFTIKKYDEKSTEQIKKAVLEKKKPLSFRVKWYREKMSFLDLNIWSIPFIWTIIYARNPEWVKDKDLFMEIVNDFAEAWYETSNNLYGWLEKDPEAEKKIREMIREELNKKVESIIQKASDRAIKNGRTTVMGKDV